MHRLIRTLAIAAPAALAAAAPVAAAPPASSPLLEESLPAPESQPQSHSGDAADPAASSDYPAMPPRSALPAPGTKGDRKVGGNASVSFERGDIVPPETEPAPTKPAPRRKGAPACPPDTARDTVARAQPQGTDDGIAQPTGGFDSATLRRVAERLVALNLLSRPADAQDAGQLADAVRAFQAANGIAITGALDRDTIGRLLVGG
ncbi:MAG: putative peptidoglycan binding domain [Pseudomonadota bacterium]|jgi:peptidoglycan hydrolase-like protein with peptidoglycan-binding domain